MFESTGGSFATSLVDYGLKGHPHLAILLSILLATVLLTHPHVASFQQHVRKLREIQASTPSSIAGNVEHVQLSSNIARNFQLS